MNYFFKAEDEEDKDDAGVERRWRSKNRKNYPI